LGLLFFLAAASSLLFGLLSVARLLLPLGDGISVSPHRDPPLFDALRIVKRREPWQSGMVRAAVDRSP
jgi:hypothetical protein